MRCHFVFLVLLAAISGCGPSAGALGGSVSPVTYSALTATRATLQSNWSGQSALAPSNLPASGTASYAGIMSLDAQTGAGNLSMAGSLTVSADFAANSISGKAQGFLSENGAAMSGALIWSNGFVDRSANPAVDPGFYADLSGTLSGGGDSFAITSTLTGDFVGPSGGAISGVISGTATSGFGSGYLTGSLIAEQ